MPTGFDPIEDLKITSDPQGATVYIDGKKVGETPLNLQGPRKGKQVLKVAKLGYREIVRTLTLPHRSQKIFITLEKIE